MIRPPKIEWSETGRCWCVFWDQDGIGVVGNYRWLVDAEAAAIEAVRAEEARHG